MADNRHADEFDKLLNGYRALKLRMIQQAAAMALSHFKESFTNQGFTDETLQKWPARKGGAKNNGRAILINRGILKRGLRIKHTSIDGAIVGEDEGIPYADIHNFGGEIKITAQMRRFFWAMYYKFGGGLKNAHGKTKPVNETALFYRNLALSKKDHITIPKRQFIGDSAMLERNIKKYVTDELNKFFKVDER
jgi:phage gpG-like protein